MGNGRVRPSANSRTAGVAVVVAVALMGVTGCSVFAMSKSEAGKQYLAILCPTNIAVDEFDRAVDTKDLASIQTAARDLSAAERTAAKKLTDDAIRWPSEVDGADRKTMADHYYRDLAWLNSVAGATTYADLPGARPRSDAFGEASQRIRAALDLPIDTSAGCEGLGDG